MPIPTLPGIGGGNINDIVDSLERQRKYIEWLLNSLDTDNVKELNADVVNTGVLNTNLVTVKSTLSGSAYLQIDGLGIRANNGFVNTFEIDSTGSAYFRGNVTSDATITGATIRTGDVGTDRIEISGGKFRGLNSSGQITGLYFDIGAVAGTGIADFYLYHNGTPLVQFYDNISSYSIRPASGVSSWDLGRTGATTYAYGTWDFTNASKVGLNHNHGIPAGTQLLYGHYNSGTSSWVIDGAYSFSTTGPT